ncbi:ty3-gypsy retrotransposon protein [Tanacetum coccineum]
MATTKQELIKIIMDGKLIILTEVVYERLNIKDHHFYVKQSKCVFGATTLEYLGHIILGKVVEMDSKKIAAIVDWPVPTNQQQIRGFWDLRGELENKASEDLKARITCAPILGLLNFEEMFVVEADASTVGIGAVLMQKGHPFSYFSRKLGPRMHLAATYQKELLAIVEVVYKWRQYLLGRRFTIRTDHRSLKELMQQVFQTPLQQKYVRNLMGFDFVIKYKPGATNQVADALSRVFDEEDKVTIAFMTLSRPLV